MHHLIAGSRDAQRRGEQRVLRAREENDVSLPTCWPVRARCAAAMASRNARVRGRRVVSVPRAFFRWPLENRAGVSRSGSPTLSSITSSAALLRLPRGVMDDPRIRALARDPFYQGEYCIFSLA